MIIFVLEIIFFTLAMIIAGRKKIMFRPNTSRPNEDTTAGFPAVFASEAKLRVV